ncbi:ExbD/TolR family protein [Planctomicrobium sp. SH661]|uniref:ExbD/TolR family protein n=1 Tax=Planctomicrobium sp. SH661 TaxID=3448124 RepID=UPI003F5B169F
MRRPPIQHRDNSPVAMTSMIDVVFLLLIFFAVTGGSGVREMLLPTELAATGSVEAAHSPAAAEPLTVEIWLKLSLHPDSGKTTVDMNGTAYQDLGELKEQLKGLAELGPENPVILEVAGDVPLGDVVDLYDTCQASGFEKVNFAAKGN